MAQLVILIANDPEDCPAILEAWEGLGVSGVTILESSGLGRLRKAGMQDDFPLLPSLKDMFGSREIYHRTLLSVVEGQEKVDQMIEAAQKIIGDLANEHTGFMFVVPVSQVIGMGKNRKYMER
jgi:nitrogen regulatory protein PII